MKNIVNPDIYQGDVPFENSFWGGDFWAFFANSPLNKEYMKEEHSNSSSSTNKKRKLNDVNDECLDTDVIERPIVNDRYDYDNSDINQILQARLREVNLTNCTVLASAVLMPGPQTGLSVGEILSMFLSGDTSTIHPFPHNLLIPIFSGVDASKVGHWVGIRIELKSETEINITYYESLPKSRADNERSINIILAQLQECPAYSFTEINYQDKCLYQDDDVSCGAFLIENMVCDLQNKWHGNEAKATIRQLHVATLKQLNSEFYSTFCAKQYRDIQQPVNTQKFNERKSQEQSYHISNNFLPTLGRNDCDGKNTGKQLRNSPVSISSDSENSPISISSGSENSPISISDGSESPQSDEDGGEFDFLCDNFKPSLF